MKVFAFFMYCTVVAVMAFLLGLHHPREPSTTLAVFLGVPPPAPNYFLTCIVGAIMEGLIAALVASNLENEGPTIEARVVVFTTFTMLLWIAFVFLGLAAG